MNFEKLTKHIKNVEKFVKTQEKVFIFFKKNDACKIKKNTLNSKI